MPLESVEGIVLRHVNYRDWDKMLTLFTREHGKIGVGAYGACRPKSPIRASTEVFTRGEYQIKTQKGRRVLASSLVLNAHYSLRERLEALEEAVNMRDLADASCPVEEEPHPLLYDLLVSGLQILAEGKIDPALAFVAFSLQAMDALGMGLVSKECVECGKRVEGAAFFSVPFGGAVCSECRQSGVVSREISPAALALLRQLEGWALADLSIIKPHPAALAEARETIAGYVSWHLERKIGQKTKFV